MPKAKDVIGYAKDKNVSMVDLKFMDFLDSGALHHPVGRAGPRRIEKAWASTGLRSAAGCPSTTATCWWCPTAIRGCWTRSGRTPPLACSATSSTRSPRSRTRATPRFVARTRRSTCAPRDRRRRVLRAEAEFSSSTAFPTTGSVNHAHYKIESREASGRRASGRRAQLDGKTYTARPNLGYKPRYKEGYFPSRPSTRSRTCAARCAGDGAGWGHPGRAPAPEVATGRTGGDRHPIRLAGEDRRQAALVQVRGENVALRNGKTVTSCPSRCSATTARGCTRIIRVGRAESRSSPARATRNIKLGLTNRRVLKHARALAALWQPTTIRTTAGSGIRGAGEPRLQLAQPVRGHPDPDVLALPQGQAHRVPFPRFVPATRTSLFGHARWLDWTDSKNPHRAGEPLDRTSTVSLQRS